MPATPDYAQHRERVPADWTDAAGLLAPAYAVVIFDRALDTLYDGIGLGLGYRRASGNSTFTMETHLIQDGPVRAGEEVVVRNHLLAVDAKRMHIAQEMFVAGRDGRVALMEQLGMHIDLTVRRSSPFPPELRAQIEAARRLLARLPAPQPTGQRIDLDTAA
jgi:acyl-CoA thioester hydrolase